MELVIANLREKTEPQPGEVLVRPCRAEDEGRRDLATLVVEKGAAAFLCGPGKAERIVIPGDPTLDDLLAAAFLMRLVAEQALPATAADFARYAQLVREGIRPADIPPEVTMEGIYLAIRNASGADLLDPAAGARFLKGWSRLSDSILKASDAGHNPFHGPLPALADHSAFAQERVYLANDRAVYRHDVERGERWRIRLPDGPIMGAGLVLRDPRSLLFRYWSRAIGTDPLEGPYLFLAVSRPAGEWVFSTNPLLRIPIRSLHETLQAAEVARNPQASANPWFDGDRFNYTLVASPHGGTTLGEKDILRIVRRWAHAERVTVAYGVLPLWIFIFLRPRLALGAGVAVVLLVLGLQFWPRPSPTVSVEVKGKPASVAMLRADGEDARGMLRRSDELPETVWSATLGVQLEPHPASTEILFRPSKVFSKSQPVRVWVSLDKEPQHGTTISLQVNDDKEGPRSLLHPQGDAVASESVGALFRAGENIVSVRVINPTEETRQATVQLNWQIDASNSGTLHILSVGVSKYPRLGQNQQLTYPKADAEALSVSLGKYSQGLFKTVRCYTPLINDKATYEDILKKIERLGQDLRENDLVIVTFAGHGGVDKRGDFHFCPYNYDETNKLGTGVYWKLFRDTLKLPCPVWLIVDCCHAGAITEKGLRGNVDDAIRRGGKQVEGGNGKIALTAACLSGEFARERSEWGHGALTLALLEGLKGKTKFPTKFKLPKLSGDGALSLQELADWARRRVAELTEDQQETHTNHTGNFKLTRTWVGKRKP